MSSMFMQDDLEPYKWRYWKELRILNIARSGGEWYYAWTGEYALLEVFLSEN